MPDANLRAAIEIDTRVAATIESGASFLAETILSSDKYLDDIDRARVLGFEAGVVYVGLRTPEHAIARVRLRVRRGGHDMPPERVAARWHRSIAMLGCLAPEVARLFVFDNTGAEGPGLIALKVAGIVTIVEPNRIPEFDAVLAPPEEPGA